MINKLKADLQKYSNKDKSIILSRFFKTGPGQYGEGDKFLGIKVPEQREVAKKYYKEITLKEIQELLNSDIHEYRLTAVIILTYKYKTNKKEIYEFYLKNFKNINNWDLVDLSAPNIVGDYLLEKDRSILYKFANSNHLWTKRIAILSTYTFIKNNQYEDTLRISEILMQDSHDLIHKAVGWMLRELGKRNEELLINFLNKHYKKMPRTMLRYSIEKFPEEKRKFYLAK
nr:DNA alkylation repair protein [Nanoarchaeum sp.]